MVIINVSRDESDQCYHSSYKWYVPHDWFRALHRFPLRVLLFIPFYLVMGATWLSFYRRYWFLNSFLIDLIYSTPSHNIREMSSFTRHCVYRQTEMHIERIRIVNSHLNLMIGLLGTNSMFIPYVLISLPIQKERLTSWPRLSRRT